MLTTVGSFRSRVDNDCDGLISELQELTGRYGEDEATAWRRSLRQLSRIFRADSFRPLHLYFGSRGNLALEYQLPSASSWCDVVLLGRHANKPSAVILELKDWQTAGDQPGRFEGLVLRKGVQELHPSDQVRGYTEYCRRFHSAVQEFEANVHGCVLFTRDPWTDAYRASPNDRLAMAYPLFTMAEQDVSASFPAYFQERLTESDAPFAEAFATGRYRQERGFVAQIGAQILDPSNSAFELLDGQRRAFAECSAVIRDNFHAAGTTTPPKRVVIVKGPPGSGKSVIAARLWASLVTDQKLPEGDVVMVTTSLSQYSNWQRLFEQSAEKGSGARGIVRKATQFSPITIPAFSKLRKTHGEKWLSDSARWRENLEDLRVRGVRFKLGSEDNANLVSIVDEAHALINPAHAEGRGKFGFVGNVGPQAYHIIRSSLLSVFLLDPEQGFRTHENTTFDDLCEWSRELGAGDPIEVDLTGMQFRCAGSREFVGWAEGVLAGVPSTSNATLARSFSDRSMDVRVFDEPISWEKALRDQLQVGRTARLLSSFSREWKTFGNGRAHELPAHDMDFHEQYAVGEQQLWWSRIWNVVPDGDYTWFVAGRSGSHIADDPLCEVGCTYAVRGFDFDYVGLFWGDDLKWRGDRWLVDPSAVRETGYSTLPKRAAAEQAKGVHGAATVALQKRVAQAYRILLTRAHKGVYLWVPDDETREYLRSSLFG
ncbi:MAG: DUF2075 domain-containing protein [Gemmatimonadaceae bacterium]|nr:DUF2075 domain-containing protein [Gemmatimonadaceae bacterium]